MVRHFFSLPFLLLSLFLLLLLLLTLLAAIVPVVVIFSVFGACLRCSLFAILRYETYRFTFIQSHVPFSVGSSSTTRIPFDTGGTSSGSDSICSQGYIMDCFFAIQRSFLSQNWYFQCIIGNQVWPVWIYYFHVQTLQAHHSVQSVSSLPY